MIAAARFGLDIWFRAELAHVRVDGTAHTGDGGAIPGFRMIWHLGRA
ncbi:hypothetical protein [Nonomuraea endophytica]